MACIYAYVLLYSYAYTCLYLYLFKSVMAGYPKYGGGGGLVTKSCPDLAILVDCSLPCNAMDCILPCIPVHGILQVGIVEWVAISFSRGSSRPSN